MEENTFIALLRCFVNGTKPELPEGCDLRALLACAYFQNLLPVVAYLDKKWSLVRQAEIKQQLKEALYTTLVLNVNRCSKFSELSAALSEHGISHMPVKGWYLREVYPVPELRTSGDVDVLIHAENRMETDTLLLSLGYEPKQNWEPTYAYCRDYEEYEFHTNLMDSNLDDRSDLKEYFSHAWEHALKQDGCCFAPEPEFHLAYLICHLAKHLYSGGAGIRMYLDIALFLKRYDAQLDWVRLRNDFSRLKLERFFQTVMSAATTWFCVATRCELPTEDKETLEELLNYTLHADLFGKLRDRSVVQLRNEQTQSKWCVLKSMLFPSIAALEKRYTFVRGKKWLVPAAWIARLFSNFARIPIQLRKMKQIKNADAGNVSAYDRFMSKVGL